MKSSGEHRRGRSMGSDPPAVIRSGEKDEDLALFHEMKRREKHNFLHPSPDDLDATLSSKFGGMGAPTKKPGTDLLTSESDKNDYDWLLTPPGTPLFPSLDQEAAALAVLSPALSNGSYSSASSASKSLKSSTYSPAESVKGSRGNPSPRRQMSTGSTTPNGISRSRSSPSTAPVLTRPSTPTSTGGTRPSTPTSKSSTPSVRASTPTLKLTISHSSKSYSNVTTPTGTRPSTPTPRSSTPTARPATPGGRSSTPNSKPSTPTMRRSLSGGRTGITSPSPNTTRGGPSPKRSTSASRGNSPSAKRITSVITSIAGMSSEAPPNLRTTMPERSTSNGKGAHSNGSNHNVEDSAQSRRRPRSPSVARSFSSSSSQEQRTSSQTSRGSVISSYDDGLEVNRPSSYGSGRNTSTGKWHAAAHEELLGGKASAYAKRVARSSSSKEIAGYGGTPSKKPSELVKRTGDAYQNSPTSAYRHLHSSSPGSPFFSTRTNSLLLRAGVGMNSSMTTSSNASSEHGTTVAADTEGSERDEDDLLSWDSYGRRASMSPRLQQADILVLDKDDEKTAPWQDSSFERANSHGPSSSHSQGSQSTLDAEVTGFYETDGIASLEMLEQLGLMGESYPPKKNSSFKGVSSEKREVDGIASLEMTEQLGVMGDNYPRKKGSPFKVGSSDEKRVSSTEDIKIPSFNDYGLSRVSPAKVYQESQGSPARHLAQYLEKQGIPERPRKSRDFESKVPDHLVFQENPGTPTKHLTNLEKPQDIPDRPRKSRDLETKTSPYRRFSLEGQGSPSRRLAQLEKQESLERPRKSRDFESKTSPHRRFSLEGQGSPSRRLAQLEKQDSLERPRRSRDFETELMRRSGEKSQEVVEPQVPSSEIRAACLFVRDFKVGLSPPQNQESPGHAQDNSPGQKRQGSQEMDSSPVVKRHEIDEMEMKLRNELSFDWDNSVESVEQPMMHTDGDTEKRLIDSPMLVSLPKENVGSPTSSARLSLEFPFTAADTVYQTKINDSLATPEMSKHGGAVDPRKPDLTLQKNVKLDQPVSINGTQSSTVIDDSSVHDGVMDESETESPPPKEVDMDFVKFDLQRSPIRDALQFTSQVLGVESDVNDDGVYAMDEDITEMHVPEDGATASVSEEETVILEELMEGGHAHITENQHISPMDVDEVSIAVPENYGEEATGGIHEKALLAEMEQEAVHEEEVDVLQSSEEDAASEGLYKIRYAGAGTEQGGVEEEEGMYYSEEDNQQDVVESFLQAVPFELEMTDSEVGEKELCYGKEERGTIAVETDGIDVLEGQIEQGVHSNGDHLSPNSEAVPITEKESTSDNEMESVSANVTDDHSPLKLPRDAHRLSPLDVQEISTWTLQICPAKMEGNPESPLDHSQSVKSVDHGQNDVLTYATMLDATQDPPVEQVDIKATQAVMKGVFDLSNQQVQEESQNRWLQEESQSPDYIDIDGVAQMDDTGDEAGSNLSNHLLHGQFQSPCESQSVNEVHDVSATREDMDFVQKDEAPSLNLSEEAHNEGIDLFHEKLTEFDAPCVENQQLSYASASTNNCQPNSVHLDENHPEVLDLSPNSDDVGEVQPPKPEFRSASTLCAALEEQIAGLIQKIDSAIEESSKPFSPSPQESLLLKDKRSMLESEQDECTGSMRSSQEEELIDMLWAEDGETSCSEESRDQDFLNGKECSQREMNSVVRSCRLSDRGLPISLLGHSNDGYDAVVRASRSDLGVEKRMLEGSSKRSAVLPLDQLDDAVLMNSREPMKITPLKSPMKSPVKSPFLWSKEMNAHDPLPEAHFHLDSQSETDKTSGEVGQVKPDGELRTMPFGQEYGSDSLTESSSCYDVEEMKTDAELLSLSKGGEQNGGDLDILENSSVVLVTPKHEAGPVENEVSLPKETLEADAPSSEESIREAGESSEAAERALPSEDMTLENVVREEEMSNVMPPDNNLTVEARDQAMQEQADNGDTDESPISFTFARSEITSKAISEVPSEDWLHRKYRKNMLPEEDLSKPVPPIGHVAEEPVVELNEEPQRIGHVTEELTLELNEEPQRIGHVTEEPAVELNEEPQGFKELEVEMMEDSPSSSPTSELVDPKLEKEETSSDIDFSLSSADIGGVQMSQRDVHSLWLSSQSEVSPAHTNLGAGGVEEPERSSGIEIEDGRKVMPGTHSMSNGIVESTQLSESNSTISGVQRLVQRLEANAHAEVNGAGLFTGQEWQQRSPRGHLISPNKSQISPRVGAGRSLRYDEIPSEGASPSKSLMSPRGSTVRSCRFDEIPSEGASPSKSQTSPGGGAVRSWRYDEISSEGASPSKSLSSPRGGAVRSWRYDEIPSEGASPSKSQTSPRGGAVRSWRFDDIPSEGVSPSKSLMSQRGGAVRSCRFDECPSEGASPRKSQTSPRSGAVRSLGYDETPSEAGAVVQEMWMSQGRPDSSPRAFSNGSGEEVQIQKVKSNQRHGDSSNGQHISLISGSRAERDSFRMEENDSGAELGRQHSSRSPGMVTDMIGRESMSNEAHVIDEVRPQESQTHFKEEGIAEGHQEVTRLSVIRSRRDLPALNLNSPRMRVASNEEMRAHHEDLGVGANGNGDLGTREEKDSRMDSPSMKRLPSNRAKSVRTISLSPRSRIESASEEPSSPDGVHTPQKSNALSNITVVSPDSLQWDHHSPAIETPTKVKTSPASLSRNMTLAEATDTILYCSSLMHTIVYQAAAYAIEKEELAASESTPISNGEVPHYPVLSSVVNTEGNDPQVGETGSCKSQGVNNGPPSVRRALSYTGHQTVPLTPADTSLQIPVDQVIENIKAPKSTAQTASQVNQKDTQLMAPVKVSKGKCGCSIM